MSAVLAKQRKAATAAAQAAAATSVPAVRNRKRKAMQEYEYEPAGPAAFNPRSMQLLMEKPLLH